MRAELPKPCGKCPFLCGKTNVPGPDLTRQHAEAVVGGSWACCHVNMGDCNGAARFRANVEANRSLYPDVLKTVEEIVEKATSQMETPV